MKKFFAIAAALLIGVAAFAQETNKDENGNTKFGGYETNKFLDNWTLGVGVGVNSTWDVIGGNEGFVVAFPAIQVDLGKWFTPEFGARLSWRGLQNKLGKSAAGKEAFNYVKVDGLVHLSNLFAGYKENRLWDVVFLGGVGDLIDDQAGHEWGVEAGFQNNFHLSDKIDLNVELGGNLAPGARYGNFGKFVTFPYAIAGIALNLGRNNWTRVSTTAAAAAAAAAAAEAAAKKAAADADKAIADANAAAKNAQDEAKQLVDEAKKANTSNVDDLFNEPVVVYFTIGKSTLSSTEKAHAEYAIKNIISRGENVKFTLNGSADTGTGSKKRNEQLSKERAQTVYNLVDELGVSRENITVVEWDGTERFATPELNRAVIIEKQ